MSIEKGKIINIRSTFSDDEKVVIAGFNDSQGLNANTTPWKKGTLDYLSSELFPDRDDVTVINGFSLTLNKTEHLDQVLKHNPTVADIKLARVYAAKSAMRKVMQDIHLPQVFGDILGSIYGLTDKVKPGDKDIHVSDAIKEAEKPIIIYSSGSNDIMRIVGTNPFPIMNQYKKRDTKPNFNYALAKVNDEKTITTVIDSIERNFENIYRINPNAEVFTLGTPVPKVFMREELKAFRDFVIAYNAELQTLCKEYGTSYIDTVQVGKEYNNSNVNFHHSARAQVAISDLILERMHENRFGENANVAWSITQNDSENELSTLTNHSVFDIINDINIDRVILEGMADELKERIANENLSKEERIILNYELQRAYAVIAERKRESEIWQNVKKKNYNM